MSSIHFSRREMIGSFAALAAGVPLATRGADDPQPQFKLATFTADVTPPLGHPLIAGWRQPAKTILNPLSARGWVLTGGEKPLVLVALDWCELRNDAYDAWRDRLARAAGTDRARVLLTCVHQHDAPYADLTAQRLLDEVGLEGEMFDPEFHTAAIERTAAALTAALPQARRVTHLGYGQAEVEQVACNRRVQLPGQPPRFNRYSFTRDAQVRDAPDGVIDPQLKTLAFFDGDVPLSAVHTYATHPMSYYGRGEVSFDFPGLAREARQRETPQVQQIYLSGCSGDVVAARYNDGTPEGRAVLADRLLQGIRTAWDNLKRVPLAQAEFRSSSIQFQPETGDKFSVEALRKTVANPNAKGQARSTAALGLSWHARCERGEPIDLPVLDLGPAQLTLAPAEAFVAYQLAAQRMRPDGFVVVAGYGECAPGYIPTAKTRAEGFVREHGYCWVAEGSEQVLMSALRSALANG